MTTNSPCVLELVPVASKAITGSHPALQASSTPVQALKDLHTVLIERMTWQKGIFENKVVFCTGGSGDIGSAQVRGLVSLGANACIIGRNREKAERVAAEIASVRPGAKVLAYAPVDVRNPNELERAASQCVSALGGIDYVIAGAAGNFLAPFLHLSNNAFRTVLEIDLMGAWNTAKATVPHLLESARKYPREGGRIIFVGMTAHFTGCQLNTHATVAKAGIDALSAQLAIELGPRGITSNVIAPGPIAETEGVRRLIEQTDAQEVTKQIPLGCLGDVEDIANATIYLFSKAGNYVNGSVLVVDGGAWRTGGGNIGTGVPYPEFLLSGESLSSWRQKAPPKL